MKHHCVICRGPIFKPWPNKKYCGSCRLRERRASQLTYYYSKARVKLFKGCADCGNEVASHRRKRCIECQRKKDTVDRRKYPKRRKKDEGALP